MRRVLGAVAVAGLLLGTGLAPAAAAPFEWPTSQNAPPSNFNPTLPAAGTIAYGNNATDASSGSSDLFGFTLAAFTNFNVNADAISVPGAQFYSTMELEIFAGNPSYPNFAGPALADTGVVSNVGSIFLNNVLLGPGSYVLEVLWSNTAASAYSGFISASGIGDGDVKPTPTPLPAALPLFATGLGFFGWWSRKRKKQIG
jgi:hypothetical protein